MVYFLYGDKPLQLKYESLLKKIREENIGIAEKFFDASQDEMDSIFQAINLNNMFASMEMIVVKKIESLSDIKKFFNSLSEFNYSKKILILLYEEFLNDYDKPINEIKGPILKTIEKTAEIIVARKSIEKKAILFYIENELSCSSYEAEKFMEMIGENFIKIKNEIDKTKNFLNGDKFDLEKIRNILSVSNEFNINFLTENFLYSKSYDELLKNLNKTKNYLLFLSIISEEITLLLKLKDLEERGIISQSMNYNFFKDDVYPNIKKYFKRNNNAYISQYPLFLKFKYLGNFSTKFLSNKLKDCLDAEFKIKSGILDDVASIEIFIINFFNK